MIAEWGSETGKGRKLIQVCYHREQQELNLTGALRDSAQYAAQCQATLGARDMGSLPINSHKSLVE